MAKSAHPDDLLFEDPYEAIYEVFCGYQKVERNESLERQGIDFQRLKEMNRLFSAKMSDAGGTLELTEELFKMVKSADRDGSGYVSCNEFSNLLKQNLFNVADNLGVDLENPNAKKLIKSGKGKAHRSMIGRKPTAMRSTYASKRTMRG